MSFSFFKGNSSAFDASEDVSPPPTTPATPKPSRFKGGSCSSACAGAIKLSLAMIISSIMCTVSMYDNSGSMYSFVPYVMRALSAPTRKKDGINGHAHFSCTLSTNGNLPQSGLTDIRLPFNQLGKFIAEHPTQKIIHVKLITDGGHNVSAFKDFIASVFNALKCAFHQDVKLVFTVIMMGDYVRYNCWICTLSYFCTMFSHDCYIVYKPTLTEIMVHKTRSDGMLVWERIYDPHTNSSDAFGEYISHDMFIKLSENCGAIGYANAFLKSTEMSGLPTDIRTACQKFWQESIIGPANSHDSSVDSSSEEATFKYPANPSNVLEMVSKFFADPPKIQLSSALGMNAMSDLFSAELLEKGILYMPFIDMFDEQKHEERINAKTSRAIPPPRDFVESTIGNPSRAHLLKLLIDFSSVNVTSYNTFIEFISVNFVHLDQIVAVSIVKKSGSPIVKQSFVEAMIDLIANKRPFFPSMEIEVPKQDAYTRFISEVCKTCMVTSMDPYNVDPATKRKSLKQLMHVLIHLASGMSANQGFTPNSTIRNVQLATEFVKQGGFFQKLVALPEIAAYMERLYQNIIADAKVEVGCDQKTKFSSFEMRNLGVFIPILYLFETRKAHPTYAIFCKSFVDLYAKMVCGGEEDSNPTRNWKNMSLQEPLMLALAVLQGLYPEDLALFFKQKPEIPAQYIISLQLTKKQLKPRRCTACVTVETPIIQLVFVETNRRWSTQSQTFVDERRETYIQKEHRHHYPADMLTERQIPGRTIINNPEPCKDCYEEVPDRSLEVLSEKIFEDPIFRKWLAEWMVTRHLDKLTTLTDKAGTADSILTELNKRFQQDNVYKPRQVSYYLSSAFGEADYIIGSFRALLSATSSPGDYDHLIPSHLKMLTNFRPGLIKHMPKEITGLEKTIGAERWIDLLAYLYDELAVARIDLPENHAKAPVFSTGETVCGVCGFIVAESTITEHEAKVLGLKIPTNLLTPICTENADGRMKLGTIDEATTMRKGVPKFQTKFPEFIEEYQPGGLLEKWHEFGCRPATENRITFLQRLRISSDQFMLLLKLHCGISYMCRFDHHCNLTAIYALTDVDFKTNELNRVFPLNHSGISASRINIQNQVRKIYN